MSLFPMRRSVVSALLAPMMLLVGAAQSEAQVSVPDPHLEFLFNDTGTTAVNSGSFGSTHNMELRAWEEGRTELSGTFTGNTVATDLHSASGTGVSGLAGDRAFDNTASTTRNISTFDVGDANAGGGAYLRLGSTAGMSLTTFTISGWIKPQSGAWGEQDQYRTTLFEFFRNSNNNIQLSNNSGGNGSNDALLQITSGGTTTHHFAGQEIWNDTPEAWVFFAVRHIQTNVGGGTADRTVEFLTWDPVNGITVLASDVRVGTNIIEVSSSTGADLVIGNDRNGIHAFDGYMDNFRLHRSALTNDQLNALAAADIPEPGSLALLGVGAALMVLRRRHEEA